jgi:hypothetical protein
VRFRVCSIFRSFGNDWMANLRSGGPIGEKWRPSVGKVREWYVKS